MTPAWKGCVDCSFAGLPQKLPLLAGNRLQSTGRLRLEYVFHTVETTGIVTRAQVKVADAIKKRAPDTKPDLFINVGDNFYWGGVNTDTRHHSTILCHWEMHHTLVKMTGERYVIVI